MNRNELIEKIREEGDSKEGTYNGYRYIILRRQQNTEGTGWIRPPYWINLNGYVAIPEDHPFYNKSYDFSWCGHDGCREHNPEYVIEVHGGITYSDEIEFSDGKKFCYGFDTAHAHRMIDQMIELRDSIIASYVSRYAVKERDE
jgi:hypothetical protein